VSNSGPNYAQCTTEQMQSDYQIGFSDGQSGAACDPSGASGDPTMAYNWGYEDGQAAGSAASQTPSATPSATPSQGPAITQGSSEPPEGEGFDEEAEDRGEEALKRLGEQEAGPFQDAGGGEGEPVE
jgi:hypothetical protein